MLGPGGVDNMPKVVEKLKVEYTDQVASNKAKAQKLDLYESLGPEFKKLASAFLDLEKKIKYTRVTLSQLESMFK
jgi:HAUS augmin-like complex subunit 4